MAAVVFLLAGDAEEFGRGARGDDDRLGLIGLRARDELLHRAGEIDLLNAVVLETRADDAFAHAACQTMHHAPTEVCATTERRFLRAFGGGCSVPVAAYATAGKETVTLCGVVASPDGATVIRERREGPLAEAEALADALVETMNAQGAFKLFERK